MQVVSTVVQLRDTPENARAGKEVVRRNPLASATVASAQSYNFLINTNGYPPEGPKRRMTGAFAFQCGPPFNDQVVVATPSRKKLVRKLLWSREQLFLESKTNFLYTLDYLRIAQVPFARVLLPTILASSLIDPDAVTAVVVVLMPGSLFSSRSLTLSQWNLMAGFWKHHCA
ncbi:uncharacterized protein BP5553_02400 [Venustampulla echinocandica]|uniref:Uncharacterized protein n=1 Tax=Venustampulla echinocandica TaxID=2656787 RepID=A0A370U3R6_9HELO|nr:uncharacterized protein BP5553_02400 [Venustampulla echinocandica]RDL42421.1 hypothetical protein BP5553_02400 [Venustampulla echinocandica]